MVKTHELTGGGPSGDWYMFLSISPLRATDGPQLLKPPCYKTVLSNNNYHSKKNKDMKAVASVSSQLARNEQSAFYFL